MTDEEHIAEMFHIQGFLVIGTQHEFAIGDRISATGRNGLVKTPLKVEGLSTIQEFDAQDRLSNELSGDENQPKYDIPYFYRVVAMD